MGDISEIKTELVITKNSTGESVKLEAMLADCEVRRKIAKIAARLAFIHRLNEADREDLEQELYIRMLEKYDTINDPKSLYGWLFIAGRNICNNIHRHSKVEVKYLDKTKSESQDSKRLGGKTLVQSSPVPTPHDEYTRKEHKLRLNDIVRKATESYPEDLVKGWKMNKEPKEIAYETGRNIKTVYRKLHEMQQAIKKAMIDNGFKPDDE